MVQFIFTNLLLISLGVIFYLLARTLPRVADDEGERRHGVLERLIMSGIPHKVDAAINTYAGKFFRKMKVHLLRMDNFLTEKIKKLNGEQNGNGKPKIDFKEIIGEKNGSEEEEANIGD